MRRLHVLVPVTVCLLAIQVMSACGDSPEEPAPEPVPVGQLVDVTECKSKNRNEDPPVLPSDRGFLFWAFWVSCG